jgi:hypothetical protein
MNWKFWRKDSQTRKLPGPKEIPQAVGTYLVTQIKMDPDLVWKLTAVILPQENKKNVFDVRVYDSNKTQRKGINVNDYHSLDDHPDLIILDGWFNKETRAVGKKDL